MNDIIGNPFSKLNQYFLFDRSFGYHGYHGYGKRSVEGNGDFAELDAVKEKVAEMFHRASQMDDEQCVKRLICEVNAESGPDHSVRGQKSSGKVA